MDDAEWRNFFLICAEQLGAGDRLAAASVSWCAYTTFERLNEDAGYWTMGLPAAEDVQPWGIRDSGTWGQPFRFEDLAHVILPAKFYWERGQGPGWECGHRLQDLRALSAALQVGQVQHRLTDLVLEIKLF